MIILDQFEEFFLYRRYADGFDAFIKELADSLNDIQTPAVFVISMREDYALELNAFKDHLPPPLFENFFRLERRV